MDAGDSSRAKDCASCGAANEETSVFCKACGRRLEADEEHKAVPAEKDVSRPEPLDHPQPGQAGFSMAQMPPLQPPPYPPRGFPASGMGYHPEGVPPGEPIYAGFWIRLLAFIIDASIVGFFFGFGFRFTSRYAVAIALTILVVYMGAFLAYSILFTGFKGQTPGKMALRLKVVRQEMLPVDMGTAVRRELAKLLSVLTLFIGFMIAGFDGRKRALHDRLAKTYVLRY